MTIPRLSARVSLVSAALLLSCLVARGDELRTLTGPITGTVTGVDADRVTLRGNGEHTEVPLTKVLLIEMQKPADLPPLPRERFTTVGLIDGSVLNCRAFSLKVKQAEAELLSGLKLRFGLDTIAWVFNESQDAKLAEEFRGLIGKRTDRDAIAVRGGGGINRLDGTIGDGDEQGATVGFELTSGRKVRPSLGKILGLIFARKGGTELPALCRVGDTSHDLFVASRVEITETAVALTTASRLAVELPRAAVAHIDFSKGNMSYLSDLTPVEVKETSTEDWVDHYRRDRNLDNGPLTLGGKTHDKGLALHAYTELVYDLGGTHLTFEALVGIDDRVGNDGLVRLTLSGDGKDLFSTVVKRGDPPQPVNVSVAGVHKLRVEVRSVDLLDLGNHLDLADARLTK